MAKKIIGCSAAGPKDTAAEFIWKPNPDQSMGYISVSVNQKNYSLKCKPVI